MALNDSLGLWVIETSYFEALNERLGPKALGDGDQLLEGPK